MTEKNKSVVRVLCAGDVNGKFKALINRLNAVAKKVLQFSSKFCVSN